VAAGAYNSPRVPPFARELEESIVQLHSKEYRNPSQIQEGECWCGTEIVQLYAADTATGVTLPAQQLIGFTRVDLEPAASKTVSFVLPMSVLAYTGLAGELVMEPGPIEVSAGSSSDDLRSKVMLTVTGKTRTIRGEDRKFFSVATVGP
jgi:beta-glucosidase